MAKIIPYGRQEITDQDIAVLVATLKSDFLTQGPEVEKFENAFAQFVGSKHAIAVNNATSALHLCTLALQVKPGQKVLCTPNTFVASSNCVLYCGGEVDFVDIDPETFCMDLNALKAKLSAHPKGTYSGIIAVDFGGYPMDFSKIQAIAKENNLWVIEDSCHAPGAEFKTSDQKWHKSGSGEFADFGIFSFHPVKHIATGEGGMITTNSDHLAKKVRLLRTHGITKNPAEFIENHGPWYHEMMDLGFNYRIPDLLCALGTSQLQRIDQNLARRRQIAKAYTEAFAKLPIKIQKQSDDIKNAFHLFVIQTDKRKELFDYLKNKSIYPQVHYIPIFKQPYYVKRYGKQSFPKAEAYYEQALSLPMYQSMTDEELKTVIQAVQDFFRG